MDSKILKEPLVSIIMNCYNGEEYLEETIVSVLNQTYQNWEIIFWDNLSSDSSKDIFESFKDSRMKYYLAPSFTDLGMARVNALKKASGDFIAILDDDDLWFPNKLEVQIPIFKDIEIGIVISDTIYFDETKKEKRMYEAGYPPSGYVAKHLLKNYFVSLETVVLRSSTVFSLPYAFDSDFDVTSDLDIVIRVSMISKLFVCKDILGKWRKYSTSLTYTNRNKFMEEREVWIEKQINLIEGFEVKYKDSIKEFKKKNLRLRAIYYLSSNQKRLALMSVIKTKPSNWIDFGLLVACLIPYSSRIIAYLSDKKWLFSYSRG